MNSSSPKRRSLTLATCCGVHGLQDGLTDLLYVLLPILAQAFGLNYSQIGIIRAANRSAMALFEIPAGLLSERFGERTLLVFGLVSVGIGYLTLSVANGFIAVVLCLFLAGFGAAFQHTLNSSVISKTFGGSGRRAALGTYNSSGDVGKLAFAGIFTLSVGVGVAWQNLVTGFGVAALLAAVVTLVILYRLDVGGRPSINKDVPTTSAALGWGFRNRTAFAALGMIVFFDIAVQGGFLTFLAFLMIEKNVPASLGAFAVVLTLVGGVFGKFSCGFLASKLGVIRSLVLVECLTAVGIVAILLLPTLAAYFLLPVIGAVLQGSSSITYGTVSDLVHDDRQSRGFSVIYSIANGAAILAPIGFGLIGDRFGLTTTMLTMACIILIPLPLCLLLRQGLTSQYV
ncbi:hexuronate transporter [bacterium MnTg02]|nr:hexuronate transporter [bacterium MnTg02]